MIEPGCLSREVVFDGTKSRLTGKEIITSQKQRDISTPDLETHKELFASGNAVLEQWKEKISGELVFIFCLETFPTPHFDDGDESVQYFVWSDVFHSWYSTYWRINDSWNVPVAVLTISNK